MEQFIIRRVRPGDLEGCCAVEAACFPPEEGAEPASIERRIRTFPEGFYVAEVCGGAQAGRIAGMINSGATHKEDITDEAFKQLVGHEPDGRNMVVFSLSVLPEYQGRGLARRLMDHFAARSSEQGRERILLLCKDFHIGFYERLGFAHGGLSASTHGGVPWHEMCRTLP